MKIFSQTLSTCLCLALSVFLVACTTSSGNKVAQKQTTYQPPYRYDAGNNQNIAKSRLETQPLPPVLPLRQGAGMNPLMPAPVTVAAASGKTKVALLLPLSGSNAGLGQAMLNAAQQAVFDTAGDNFQLQPRDTAAEGGAENAARMALRDGAQLIIGPLFASDIAAVKRVADVSGVQLLPLSTDTSLATHGVYVMGLAPPAQVERVVAYASRQGAHHFAALMPSDAYGLLVGHAFEKAVVQNGGAVIDAQYYDPATHDLDSRIKTLAQHKDQIDALFLPESGNDLKTVTDGLTSAGFANNLMHILGTGLWDIARLGTQNPWVVGGWYAAPDPAVRRNFMANYAQTYGQEPPRLATLAYDATALAAVLAKRGGRFDDAALLNPNGFAGVDGVFRLLQSGVVERAMAVNAVTADGPRVVDPAPVSFVGR